MPFIWLWSMLGIASCFIGVPPSGGVSEPCSSAFAAAASIARLFKVASSGRSEEWRPVGTLATASGLAGESAVSGRGGAVAQPESSAAAIKMVGMSRSMSVSGDEIRDESRFVV